ncbi:hypothetical protein ACIQZO_26500 [Streptomyces sp. NPDC097617]|uniref:hypothetical protein n=1 Tax=Streptomyces sp. NPDC097617 TaxID=3366091 RepID=UPI00382B266C
MCSTNTASTARAPVRAVAGRLNSGAAISGAAVKKGDPVKLGGVGRSKTMPRTGAHRGRALGVDTTKARFLVRNRAFVLSSGGRI